MLLGFSETGLMESSFPLRQKRLNVLLYYIERKWWTGKEGRWKKEMAYEFKSQILPRKGLDQP
jgi:hypothetical protein